MCTIVIAKKKSSKCDKIPFATFAYDKYVRKKKSVENLFSYSKCSMPTKKITDKMADETLEKMLFVPYFGFFTLTFPSSIYSARIPY